MPDRVRPKTKLLLVVWGKKYVDSLMAVALPSFLAPGNLPALTELTDLEVVVLTTSATIPEFSRHAAFARLEQLCRIRFVPIDDLMNFGAYGIILTIAFARGVIASGAEQTSTHFIFMNADLVLADGSLRSLAHRIAAGEPCIMVASLRAKEEVLVPRLARAVDRSSHALAVSPREAVELGLSHPHPTVIGKTVTQSLMHCEPCNQLFWRVDEHTLLARCYLLHMFCIRPETPLKNVNYYCDYGFVPELVPSGRITAFTDSDEFVAIELQSSASEREFLRPGPLAPSSLAASVGEWATAQHRRNAEFGLVFHSRGVPSGLDVTRHAADKLIADVEALLPVRPMGHANHPYWAFTLDQRFHRPVTLRREVPSSGLRISWPPELNAHLFPECRPEGDSADPLSDSLVEARTHDTTVLRLMRGALADSLRNSDRPILYVGRRDSPLAEVVARDPRFDLVHLNALAAGFVPSEIADRRYGRVVCHAVREIADYVPAAVATSLALLAKDGAITVILQDEPTDCAELARRTVGVIAELATIEADRVEFELRFVSAPDGTRERRRKKPRWLWKLLNRLGPLALRRAANHTNRAPPRPEAPLIDCSCAVVTLRYAHREAQAAGASCSARRPV